MKAFIYGWFSFPRGGPNANYVQYLALALRDIGYETYVISNPTTDTEIKMYNGDYKGIRVKYVNLREKRIVHAIDYNFMRGEKYVNAINECKPEGGDILIGYCFDPSEFIPVLKYAKSINAITCACIPEYYPRDYFTGKMAALDYRKYLYTMEHIIPRNDILFPISKYIEKKYVGHNQLVLPIMADTKEFEYYKSPEQDCVNIIYSTSTTVKDSLYTMLKAICKLSREEQKRLKFHLTGVKLQKIQEMNDCEINNLIGKVIIVHKWMNYSQLIELYRKIDFILIARPDTQLFKANFPSKVPEAMTHGIIPIVSRVGDYTELYLKDGINSIQFEGSSVEICLEQIKKALCLSKQEINTLRNNARKCAEEEFDYRNWVQRLERFIKQIQEIKR